MIKSREVRWFRKHADQSIISWFAERGMSFENTSSRTDYYLPLDQDDLNIKLREGNVEVKQRIGKPSKDSLTSQASGYFENWVKWSFQLSEADELSQMIIHSKKYDWIATEKTRMGLKLQSEGKDDIKLFPISEELTNGCQIEYTSVTINRQTYFTFGLEWFGRLDTSIPVSFVEAILGESHYDLKESMGYAGFLQQYHD